MKYKITDIEENNYIIRTFNGILSFTDIYSSWEDIIEEKLKSHKYLGVIYNFSDAHLNVQINNLNHLMDLFKKHNNIFKKLKIAVIVTSPENIIFPVIARLNTPFNIKAFSTVNAAKKWMLNGKKNQ